jgi:hypothetical protein
VTASIVAFRGSGLKVWRRISGGLAGDEGIVSCANILFDTQNTEAMRTIAILQTPLKMKKPVFWLGSD